MLVSCSKDDDTNSSDGFKDSTAEIISFTIDGIEGNITDNNIQILLFPGTNLTALTPVINHNGERISPSENTAQNFTNPVTYIVTAENGDTNTYTISVGYKEEIVAGTEFITTWSGSEITIPATAGANGYKVDWDNDGFIDQTGIEGPVSHDFGSDDTYTIRITGDLSSISFEETTEREKIIAINQWGNIVWSTMKAAFSGCTKLEVPAEDAPNLSKVSDLSDMFLYAAMANPNTTNWNTSNVTTMENMFAFADAANPNTSNWDTSRVENMSFMFSNALIADPDTSNWNVGNVTEMRSMFADTEMANPNTTDWNTSQVIYMNGMFSNAQSANPDTSGWNTLMVRTMEFMFANAPVANPDTSDWDTSNVLLMRNMFENTTVANPDTSNWDTGKVQDMSYMFLNAAMAQPQIKDWKITNVEKMNGMFQDATFAIVDYDDVLINFSAQEKQSGISFNAGLSTYCSTEAIAARLKLINQNNWTITDNGECVN